MHELVMRIKEPAKCYVSAQNAINRGHENLAVEAYRRAVDLRAEEHEVENEAELMALKSFYAYEEALSYGERRRKRATGTWQMVNKYGILPTLEKRLNAKGIDEVMSRLKDLKMEDYSFHSVANTFAQELKQAA